MLFQNLCSQGDTEESPVISQENIFLNLYIFQYFSFSWTVQEKKKKLQKKKSNFVEIFNI